MDYIMIVLLCLHLLISFVYGYTIIRNKSNLPETMIFIITLVPVFGLISALGIEMVYIKNREGKRESSLEGFGRREEIYDKYFVEEIEDANEVVPLEEALLINDSPTRRKLMMDILHKDPNQYLELLKQARFHNDMEVTHYATATIMELHREYELELQQCIKTYRSNPMYEPGIEDYVKAMKRYLDSGLLDEMMNKRYRDQYNDILTEIVKLQPEKKQIHLEILDNDMKRQELTKAREIANILQMKWPNEELVWLKSIQLSVDSRDQKLMQQTLMQIEKLRINWTAEGRTKLKFFIEQ